MATDWPRMAADRTCHPVASGVVESGMEHMSAFPELSPITRQVIGCAMAVHRALGPGFIERVYENALFQELRGVPLQVRQQSPVQVRYKGNVVGQFATDLLVEDRIIVEIKALPALHADAHAQCINYLRSTGLNLCLLLNFGCRRLEYKRLVFTHRPTLYPNPDPPC